MEAVAMAQTMAAYGSGWLTSGLMIMKTIVRMKI